MAALVFTPATEGVYVVHFDDASEATTGHRGRRRESIEERDLEVWLVESMTSLRHTMDVHLVGSNCRDAHCEHAIVTEVLKLTLDTPPFDERFRYSLSPHSSACTMLIKEFKTAFDKPTVRARWSRQWARIELAQRRRGMWEAAVWDIAEQKLRSLTPRLGRHRDDEADSPKTAPPMPAAEPVVGAANQPAVYDSAETQLLLELMSNAARCVLDEIDPFRAEAPVYRWVDQHRTAPKVRAAPAPDRRVGLLAAQVQTALTFLLEPSDWESVLGLASTPLHARRRGGVFQQIWKQLSLGPVRKAIESVDPGLSANPTNRRITVVTLVYLMVQALERHDFDTPAAPLFAGGLRGPLHKALPCLTKEPQ